MKLYLFTLAHELNNFMRKLEMAKAVKGRLMRSAQIRRIEVCGGLARHARRVPFQLAEAATLMNVFGRVAKGQGNSARSRGGDCHGHRVSFEVRNKVGCVSLKACAQIISASCSGKLADSSPDVRSPRG